MKNNKNDNNFNSDDCTLEPRKLTMLEPFWHVYAIDSKCEKVGKKIVTRFKVRVGYRCSRTKNIKAIERKLFHHNHIVYFESLNDLYYYDLSALRYKNRDLERLNKFFSLIGVDVKNYLENMYY